jgi:hypothetical protein
MQRELWAWRAECARGGDCVSGGMTERQHWHAVLASLVTGALAGVALWVLLVPWDLSEVDSSGRPLANGGDDVRLRNRHP